VTPGGKEPARARGERLRASFCAAAGALSPAVVDGSGAVFVSV